jgi:hypothetical protein
MCELSSELLKSCLANETKWRKLHTLTHTKRRKKEKFFFHPFHFMLCIFLSQYNTHIHKWVKWKKCISLIVNNSFILFYDVHFCLCMIFHLSSLENIFLCYKKSFWVFPLYGATDADDEKCKEKHFKMPNANQCVLFYLCNTFVWLFISSFFTPFSSGGFATFI